MATYGKIGEFNAGKEDCIYFTANDIDDAGKQRAILISACGAATYRRLKDVLAPQAPTDVTFDQIVEKMTAHLQPPPSEIVQRYRFNTRVRQPHESVSTYLAQLNQLAEYCNYKDTLKQMLRDRLVCGIAQPQWQKRLLAEEGLTFEKACKQLLSMEAAEKQMKDLGGHPIQQINQRSGGGKTGHTRQPPHTARQPPQTDRKPTTVRCHCCGGPHKAPDCTYHNAECHFCHKKGHLETVCIAKQKSRENHRNVSKRTHQVTGAAEEQESSGEEYLLFYLHPEDRSSFTVHVGVNGATLQMEVDTGAALSIISQETFNTLWPATSAPIVHATDTKLKSYTGEVIGVKGTIEVEVEYEDQKAKLPLVIVDGKGPTLLGRNWLHHLRLDWSQLHHIQTDAHEADIQSIIDRHPDLFQEGLGKVSGTKATIYIDDDKVKPRFMRARQVPYALHAKVEAEIDRLVREEVLEPVQFSQWATPVVPVLKPDGRVRLCGDYKLTVNPVANTDTYPLPRIEDLFASLSGGKVFSKLDMTQAYLQIPVDEESKKYTTLNTHKGLFQFTRLPFGVASAPSIFQRIMEGILQGIPGVCVYLDDILVSGVK